MQCLEDLLTSRTLSSKYEIVNTDDQEAPQHALPQHSAGWTPGVAAGSPDTPQSSTEVLNRIIGQASHLDEEIRARIESGETTIEMILRAGLDALQPQSFASAARMPDSKEEDTALSVRTDKIVVPTNRMQVHPDFLPNVYSNHLHIKAFSMVAALRANGEILGLNFQQLTDPETQSPFYNGPNTTGDAEVAVLAKFQHVPPHLRPTASQVRHAHHPYVDIIPCPIFRQRVTGLIAMEEASPSSDTDFETDLCADIEKDGLICWGSHLSGAQSGTGSGAPWDIRSWEAQPWFLKKWWFIVGGKEGALFKQSRWWHEIRGDRLPYSW